MRSSDHVINSLSRAADGHSGICNFVRILVIDEMGVPLTSGGDRSYKRVEAYLDVD